MAERVRLMALGVVVVVGVGADDFFILCFLCEIVFCWSFMEFVELVGGEMSEVE